MTESAVGYRQLLSANRGFRHLWLGNVASFAGDWFNLIALYAAVAELSDSSVAIALVMVVKTLPSFLIAPVAGPLVDRFDRRKLLLAMDFSRAAGALGLVLAYQLDSLIGLYAVATLMVCCTGVAFPSKKAALPQLVRVADLNTANALSGGTWSIMLAVGAALGGVATEAFGISAAFVIDAGTFLISALMISRLPALRPPAGDAPGTDTGFMEGVRYLRRTPHVQALASLKPMMAFANGAAVLIPIYGTVGFGAAGGALAVGLLYGARGVGATIGSFAVRSVIGDRPGALRVWVAIAYALMIASFVYLAHAETLWQAGLAFFGSTLGSGSIWVFSGTLLQVEADRRYHGRVFSMEFGVTTLIMAISAFVLGSIHEWGMPLAEVARIAATMAVPPFLFWVCAQLWLRRQRPWIDYIDLETPSVTTTSVRSSPRSRPATASSPPVSPPSLTRPRASR